jgi:hypothetical protein
VQKLRTPPYPGLDQLLQPFFSVPLIVNISTGTVNCPPAEDRFNPIHHARRLRAIRSYARAPSATVCSTPCDRLPSAAQSAAAGPAYPHPRDRSCYPNSPAYYLSSWAAKRGAASRIVLAGALALLLRRKAVSESARTSRDHLPRDNGSNLVLTGGDQQALQITSHLRSQVRDAEL